MKKYLIVFLLTILYYLGYNSIAFIVLSLVEQYLGLEYFYLVNTFTFVIILAIIAIFFVNINKRQKSFNISSSSLKTFLFILGISIFFKLLKDPVLSFYEILGMESIPNIEKEPFTIIHQISYVLYFVFLAPIAEEILFRGIILKKIIKNKESLIIPIVYSSFLFSLIHLNLLDLSYNCFLVILKGFAFGVIASIIFIKTKNLIYPILLHIISNLLAYFSNILFVHEYLKILRYLNFDYRYWLIIMLSALGLILMLRKLKTVY